MKDERLYMTYPIDMHRHPKFRNLSVEAKWAFVEMNGEARIADNDGVFTAEDAEFMWSSEVLAELVASHPTRPLVLRDGDTYVIREFPKHQQTRAEREDLRAKRSAAGRKGGLAKGQASGKHLLSASEQTQAQSQSESQDLTRTTSHNQSHQSNARANETDGLNIGRVRTAVSHHLGLLDVPSEAEIVALAADLIARSPKRVRAREAYLEGCDGESVRAAWERVKGIRGQIEASLGGAA